jgi:hypothetical protein
MDVEAVCAGGAATVGSEGVGAGAACPADAERCMSTAIGTAGCACTEPVGDGVAADDVEASISARAGMAVVAADAIACACMAPETGVATGAALFEVSIVCCVGGGGAVPETTAGIARTELGGAGIAKAGLGAADADVTSPVDAAVAGGAVCACAGVAGATPLTALCGTAGAVETGAGVDCGASLVCDALAAFRVAGSLGVPPAEAFAPVV